MAGQGGVLGLSFHLSWVTSGTVTSARSRPNTLYGGPWASWVCSCLV